MMDASGFTNDYILYDPDYIPIVSHSFYPYIFQLDASCSNLDKNLSLRFKQLYEYVDQLLSSNDTFISPIFNEETFPIVATAKREFRENSFQIITNIKRSFEQNERYQFLPDRLLQQAIEDLRHNLFITYNKMMQNVAPLTQGHSIRQSPPIAPSNPITFEDEARPKQKLKPGKTKFPKKARQVLEHWYKTHHDDPFPSYAEKARLAEEGGISIKQVKCWFINVRRKWKQELNNDDEDFRLQIEKQLMVLNRSGAAEGSNVISYPETGFW